MKFKTPSDRNRKDIENYLRETRPNRREWIMKSFPTVSQIFTEYPRLQDYNGDMVMKTLYQFYFTHIWVILQKQKFSY